MPTRRMIKSIVLASTLALAMAWPDALFAQRHGGGGGGGGGRGGGGGGGHAAGGPSRGGGGGGGRDGGGPSGRVSGGGSGNSGAVPRNGGYYRGYSSYPRYSRAYYYGPAYYYGYYGLGYYYAPFFGSPFWWGYPAFAWGYGYPYGWGYGWGYPGYPYGYGYDPRGSARTIVKPKQTEVFVDGFYVGVADDFDGIWQGMKLEDGGHEITLYLDGYRTYKQKVMLVDGKTFKLKHDMVKLGDNEPKEARPVAPPIPQRPPGNAYGPGRSGRQGPPRGEPADPDDPEVVGPPTAAPPDREGWPPRNHQGPPPRTRSANEAGHVIIRVQPAGAEVLIDGERWEMPAGQERLDIAVPDGEHKVEIRKDGYQPFTTTVTVRRGENTPLNVSLPKAP